MPRLALLPVLVWLLAGCWAESAGPAAARSSPPPANDPPGNTVAITQLAGALFLHEFPASGHGTLNVVDQPVGLAELDGREPFTLPYAPALRQGQCLLYLPPRCSPPCASNSLCTAPQVCTPLTPLLNLDIGEVRVTGSRTSPLIRLWFLAPPYGYDVDPQPGAAHLFAGGERLEVSGGRGPYALHGAWTAPAPVVVYAPPPAQPLHLPAAAAFTLRWEPGDGGQIIILVIAARPDGAWGNLRCLVADNGAFTIPANLMAALPPAPRTVRYELERDSEILVPLELAPGVGMLVHAAFTAWQNGNDP